MGFFPRNTIKNNPVLKYFSQAANRLKVLENVSVWVPQLYQCDWLLLFDTCTQHIVSAAISNYDHAIYAKSNCEGKRLLDTVSFEMSKLRPKQHSGQ